MHIPDDLLQRTIPMILVQHPALAFPSFFRVQRDTHMLSFADEAFDF